MPVKKKTTKTKPKKVVKQKEVEVVSNTTQQEENTTDFVELDQFIVHEGVIETSNEDGVFVTRENIDSFMAFVREKAFFQQLSPINIKRKLEEITGFIL